MMHSFVCEMNNIIRTCTHDNYDVGWSIDDDIGADECRWVIECDCWCDTGDDDDRWVELMMCDLLNGVYK